MKHHKALDSLSRSYHAIAKPLGKPFRVFVWTAGIAIVVYVILVGSAAYAIYKKHDENSYTMFAEKIFPYPADIVDKKVITLQRYRMEVAARQTYSDLHGLSTSKSQTAQIVSTQLINWQLYDDALAKNNIVVSDSDVNAEMNQIYSQVGCQTELTKFLHDNYGSGIGITQFQVWVRESLVESAVKEQLLQHATVSHILISVPTNATADQVEAARQKALSIKAQITSPDQFAAIAKQDSEDVASSSKGGALGVTVRGDDAPIFSSDFQNAIFSLPLNTVSDPVRSQYGWHLIIVTDRGGTIKESMKQYTKQLAAGNVRSFIGGYSN